MWSLPGQVCLNTPDLVLVCSHIVATIQGLVPLGVLGCVYMVECGHCFITIMMPGGLVVRWPGGLCCIRVERCARQDCASHCTPDHHAAQPGRTGVPNVGWGCCGNVANMCVLCGWEMAGVNNGMCTLLLAVSKPLRQRYMPCISDTSSGLIWNMKYMLRLATVLCSKSCMMYDAQPASHRLLDTLRVHVLRLRSP
jgi:hypothetical protein